MSLCYALQVHCCVFSSVWLWVCLCFELCTVPCTPLIFAVGFNMPIHYTIRFLPFPTRFAIRRAVRSPTHHPVHCYSISRCGSSHAFFRPLHRAISLSHFQCIYCRSPCLFSSDTPCVHWRIVKLSSVPRAFLVHSGAVRFAFPSPVRSDIRSPCVLLWFPSGFPPT